MESQIDTSDAEFERCKDYLYWRFKGDYCFSFHRDLGKRHMPDKVYNKLICKLIANDTVRHVPLPKTRQMLMSWEVAAYCVHSAMFHERAEIAVVNKKGEDSAYLVFKGSKEAKTRKTEKDDYSGGGRCWDIFSNQPEWIKERVGASPAHNRIQFTNGASIFGLNEGEKQLHQFQAWLVWFDEASKQEDFENRFMAAAPMARRIIVTSTPDGHEGFYRMCKDIRREAA